VSRFAKSELYPKHISWRILEELPKRSSRSASPSGLATSSQMPALKQLLLLINKSELAWDRAIPHLQRLICRHHIIYQMGFLSYLKAAVSVL